MNPPACRSDRRRGASVLQVAALVLVLAVVSCGGDDARGKGGEAATDTPAPAARGTSRPSGPTSSGALGERVSSALLTIHDMPSGWRLGSDARGDPDDTTWCGVSLGTLEQHRRKLGQADIAFERGEAGPFLTQSVVAYPEGMARQVLDDLTSSAGGCAEVTVRDDEGTLSTWQSSRIPFPELGDQTLALRQFFPVNNIEALVVYIRRGEYVTTLVHIAIRQPVDRAQTEAFARLADTRLSQLGRSP
jgi:hypothetical protein